MTYKPSALSLKIGMAAVALIMTTGGVLMIAIFSNIWVAIGVLSLVWGNNIGDPRWYKNV